MDDSMIKKSGLRLLLFFSMSFVLAGCSVDQRISKRVAKLFKQSEVLKKYHSGFALYDLSAKQMILEKDADKYFNPASNTKLFTFYAGLKMLSDSVPALRFVEKGDSVIFWGTGDPSFLQTRLKGTRVLDFLRSANRKLFFAPGRYTGSFYGKGWQWDDYNDYYQAEINELPIMDNLITVTNVGGKVNVAPKLFKDCFKADSSLKDTSYKVTRKFNVNKFEYPAVKIPTGYEQQVPYKTDVSTTLALLSDTLGKEVGLIAMEMPLNAKTVYSVKRDSVLKEMMLPSDNFIAEQLLLVYSNQIGAELSAGKAIGYIEKNYLGSLPDKLSWVDGSGLSRYNLFTPRDIVRLLELIYNEVNDPEKLFGMLPAGGKAGTLKNAYPKTDHPFVFGKTGSFSNNYNQSGYVVTKKGKTYIFSFMNNNFVVSTAAVREEMVKIITYIHENF